jgi:hypothetical protein
MPIAGKTGYENRFLHRKKGRILKCIVLYSITVHKGILESENQTDIRSNLGNYKIVQNPANLGQPHHQIQSIIKGLPANGANRRNSMYHFVYHVGKLNQQADR